MLEQIGHYRIVSELGRGGMGVVYKAHEESLNRFVAIKVLGEHLEEDSDYVDRFLREAQSAARLNHPNIVQIYAVSEDRGQHFFVMEYVSGRSLQAILRSEGPMEPTRAARVALQASAGLQAAHEQGVIHRDIKPANLMIDDRGLVKIADFGLALIGGAATRLTATGMLMGTPGYLSPEQCLDEGADHRTDIYSLGVTLFETLSGKIPFAAESPLALLRQIVDVQAPSLSELNPEIDETLVATVSRMMAKDREQRYPDCTELIGDLQAYLETRGVSGSLVENLVSSAPANIVSESPSSTQEAAQLESHPTRKVATKPAEAPPPPPEPTAAAQNTEPQIQESALTEQESPAKGERRLALAVALVVVIGFATIVAAGIFAWQRGLFDMASEQDSSSTVAEAGGVGSDLIELAQSSSDADSAAEPLVESATVGGGLADNSGVQTTDSETTITPERSNPPVPKSATSGLATPKNADTNRGSTESRAPAIALPPPTPLPEGTVVIAFGERLFAGEAEAVVEEALSRSGVQLVDEFGIPGITQLRESDEVPRPEMVRAALRPYARNLVMIRIEYLGERPLQYMGQPDIAFQARLTAVPIDLHAGRALIAPQKMRVEYTHLNARRVAEEKLRQPSRRIATVLLRN